MLTLTIDSLRASSKTQQCHEAIEESETRTREVIKIEEESDMKDMTRKAIALISHELCIASKHMRSVEGVDALQSAAKMCVRFMVEVAEDTDPDLFEEAYQDPLAFLAANTGDDNDDSSTPPDKSRKDGNDGNALFGNVKVSLQRELELIMQSLETHVILIQSLESIEKQKDVPSSNEAALSMLRDIVDTRGKQAYEAWSVGHEARNALEIWLSGGRPGQEEVSETGGFFSSPFVKRLWPQSQGTPDLIETQQRLENLKRERDTALVGKEDLRLEVESLSSTIEELTEQLESMVNTGEKEKNALTTEVMLLKEGNSSMVRYVAKLRVAMLIVMNQVWRRSSKLAQTMELWRGVVVMARHWAKERRMNRAFTLWALCLHSNKNKSKGLKSVDGARAFKRSNVENVSHGRSSTMTGKHSRELTLKMKSVGQTTMASSKKSKAQAPQLLKSTAQSIFR